MAYYDQPGYGGYNDDPTNTGGPTGIPDPSNPGYDTGGYPLQQSGSAPGDIPEQGTGPEPGRTVTPTPGPGPVPTNTPPPSPAPPGSDQLASPGSTPGFWPSYTLPTPYQFTPYSGFTPYGGADPYTPLTGEQAANEPGYAFARDQGRQALEQSAANNGTVLGGGHLKDLFSWGDQFAGQNYQNAETRNENIYGMNQANKYRDWLGNETGKYQQWSGNQGPGLAAWIANNQPGQFGANFQQGQAQLTLADLLARFNTTVDANTRIATAGAS